MKTWLKVRVVVGDHAMQHTPHSTLAQWSQQYNKCPRQIFLAVARIVDYLHYVFLDGFASEALS